MTPDLFLIPMMALSAHITATLIRDALPAVDHLREVVTHFRRRA